MEYRIFHRDGSVRWVRDQAHVLSRDALGRPTEIQGLVVDVTEARRIDRERREARTRYRSLVEAIPAMTYLEHASPEAPEESRFAFVSPQIEGILGFTPDEATSDPLFFERTLHPDDLARIREANVRAESTGEPFDEEFRQLTKGGEIRWMHDRAVLVRDDDGAPRSGTASRSTSPIARRPNATCVCSRSGTAPWSNRSRRSRSSRRPARLPTRPGSRT